MALSHQLLRHHPQSNIVNSTTWPELTGQQKDYQPYTEDKVKQVITKDVDPAGHELELVMPRWQMSPPMI